MPPIASHSLPLKYKCLPWPLAFVYFIKNDPRAIYGITASRYLTSLTCHDDITLSTSSTSSTYYIYISIHTHTHTHTHTYTHTHSFLSFFFGAAWISSLSSSVSEALSGQNARFERVSGLVQKAEEVVAPLAGKVERWYVCMYVYTYV